jgi:hypothetical protein
MSDYANTAGVLCALAGIPLPAEYADWRVSAPDMRLPSRYSRTTGYGGTWEHEVVQGLNAHGVNCHPLSGAADGHRILNVGGIVFPAVTGDAAQRQIMRAAGLDAVAFDMAMASADVSPEEWEVLLSALPALEATRPDQPYLFGCRMAEHPNVPSNVLAALAEYKSEWVRQSVARAPGCPAVALEAFIAQGHEWPNSRAHSAACGHPTLPQHLVAALHPDHRAMALDQWARAQPVSAA